jgi:hypothetical protein
MSEPIPVNRHLVAVFAADVEGYSRLTGVDEVSTLKGLIERRATLKSSTRYAFMPHFVYRPHSNSSTQGSAISS